MKCPKCGIEIDENALNCPNCKKVLKLVCPICNTVNDTNTCRECGYIIISKCHQCGKINPTINGKCSRCGFDTNVSAILQNSNIEEFAALTIKFPNIDDIEKTLGSKQLYKKFRQKLNDLIYGFAKTKGLKRAIFDSTYVIRFNKDYTYASSVNNAMQSAIELLNIITKMNYKLLKNDNFVLKCHAAILKRNATSSNESYTSGVNINIVYQDEKASRLHSNLQLIADSSIYEILSKNYTMESIGMIRAKNSDIFLYQLDLTKYVNIEFEEEEEQLKEEREISIPDLIDETVETFEEDDSIYDIEGITFNEINCQFKKDIAQGISSKIVDHFRNRQKSILTLRGKKEFQPRTLEYMEKICSCGIFNSIIQITCSGKMKYRPYGFFAEMIIQKLDLSSSDQAKNKSAFSKLIEIDKDGFLASALCINKNVNSHPDEIRENLFRIFKSVVSELNNSLIVIENIEKMDDSSFELFKQIIKDFSANSLSYVITCEKDFALHKEAHFLLSRNEYTEIYLKPSPIAKILEANSNLCQNIIDNFYMKKIIRNTKGSQIYFMQALVYLIDMGIFKVNNGVLELGKTDTLLFPTTLDELIKLRLKYLKSLDADLFKIFACMLIIGPQVEINDIKALNIKQFTDYISFLDSKGFISYNNGLIQIQSYEMLYENLISILSGNEKRELSNLIIRNIYSSNTITPVLANIYEMTNDLNNAFAQWENLAEINNSLGDYGAYLNCSLRLIKLLSMNTEESNNKQIEEYTLEIYENISNQILKYSPKRISTLIQTIIENIEVAVDDKKIINLCGRIMQGAIISGNYAQALHMAHKILSKMENYGINPQRPNFNPQALQIALTKLEILFNTGDYDDCITLGEEIFGYIQGKDISLIAPKTTKLSEFKDLIINSAGYLLFSKALQLKDDINDYSTFLNNNVHSLPDSYKIFTELVKVLKGEKTALTPNLKQSDKFSSTIFHIITAFSQYKTNQNEFAEEIYKAKLQAKEHSLCQAELFCDIMIGKAYLDLNKDKKASVIFNSVLETAQKNGLKNLYYLSAYYTAELSLKNNDTDTAYGIASNTIVEIENSRNKNYYLLMIFKYLYAKVFQQRHETEQAKVCMEQAQQIAKTFNINLK